MLIKEIYLFGGSGGGHAALLATAYKPELWNTVISYVPIVDIRKWHAECKSRGLEFYKDIEACIGECTPDNYLYFVKSQRRLKRQQKNRAPV
ncbi:MAG TPA: prolyl oligopeptidase family serine peptidase [Candidatus Caccalectryoclostridium excrementigallinarum]|uniref:Prolyl oligopeptidase family serine peptidase n=1 Tax=Candidatus Caccalectryoclostridium excrementigallinarum TaxID=2840710 RepID=A0A9D1MN88_9FIRM|nr:prolyl oligopeptidase family serine peptidase [Candidatus Caccalectryoclostridium excrementigallinarum]